MTTRTIPSEETCARLARAAGIPETGETLERGWRASFEEHAENYGPPRWRQARIRDRAAEARRPR